MNHRKFVLEALRGLVHFLPNSRRAINRRKPGQTIPLLAEGFELEPRIVPDAYIWDSGNANLVKPPMNANAWGATNTVKGVTYTNWYDTNTHNNWSGIPGKHNATNDTVTFESSNPGSNVNCTIGTRTGALTLAGFSMGNGMLTYTGTLDIKASNLTLNGGGNGGAFFMNSGTITIDSGNNNAAGFTLTDLGSSGNAWQGGTINNSSTSNNYVELNSVAKASVLDVGNSVVNTGSSSLLSSMHIDGSSNGKAQLILDSSMTKNLQLGVNATITVGSQGQLLLTDQNQDGGTTPTTDNQGGIVSATNGDTKYAVIVNSGGQMARGQSGNSQNYGGVLINRPIENNGGAVDIYPGDRLDISGADSNGNAFYQPDIGAVTTVYEVTTHANVNFVGSLVTASDYTIRNSTSATYGNIDIKGGKLVLQTYNSSGAAPAYPSLLMGPIVASNNATTGSLSIEVGATLVVTAHGRGSSFLTVQMAGNLTFSDGSNYQPDCWSNVGRMCELDIVSAGSSNNNYNITIGPAGSTCNMQDLGGNSWTKGASGVIVKNRTGGTNTGSFASNQDSNGNHFSWFWLGGGYTLTY